MKTTRRGFLIGCSAAAATLAAAQPGFAFLDRPDAAINQDILIVVFLRGGCDALNLIPPVAGEDRALYEAARPSLQVPASGPDAALALDGRFGLHPATAALHALFQDGKLAVVLAAGMHEDTRSHFDAMQYMELGTPGKKGTSTGWLTRHLKTAPNLPDEIMMPSLAMGNIQPTALLGSWESIGMNSTSSFNLSVGPSRWRDAQRHALRKLYGADSTSLHLAGTQALNAVDIIETSASGSYEPGNGAVYPSGTFGTHLKTIAQMIKLQLGLRIASVDLGGWDTHRSQGSGAGGYFATKVGELANGLAALYTDLAGSGDQDHAQRTTMVVMSEFGRRFRANDNQGTDHGHGGMMLVAGGKVKGGVFGSWPGLQNEHLYDGADLAVGTDYRRVLSEILIRRLGNPNLGTVFPVYNVYEPLDLVEGIDLAPVYASAHKVHIPFAVRNDQP